jgi:hypothetical protein
MLFGNLNKEKSEYYTKILILDFNLYQLSNSIFGHFTPTNVINHVEKTLKLLYPHKEIGFVNKSENQVILLLISILFTISFEKATIKNLEKTEINLNWLERDPFNLEYFYNVILLLLLKDILIVENLFCNSPEEIYQDLKPLREKILAKITGGIRSVISKKDLIF